MLRPRSCTGALGRPNNAGEYTMSNKTPPYSMNYSVQYKIGGGQGQVVQPKPRMLTIAAIPDDHTIIVDFIDHKGVEFNATGNFFFPALSGFEREEIVLGGVKGERELKFTMPDIVFNRICDPDSNKKGLKLASKIIDDNKIPALNHPEKVLATKRDVLYQRFANVEGVVVPRTVRVSPKYCREVQALLEQGVVSMPCIFRPAGGHNSRGVVLLGKPGDASELERFAFDGRDYYISELYDCRDEDGLFRKFRVVYIGGKIFPRHLFVSNEWCVDGKSKLADERSHSEEQYFMENFESYLGAKVLSRLHDFCAKIGLDFFGLDLNLRPDGTLVVFEANACMSAFRDPNREYLQSYVDGIRKATEEMIMRLYQAVAAKA